MNVNLKGEETKKPLNIAAKVIEKPKGKTTIVFKEKGKAPETI